MKTWPSSSRWFWYSIALLLIAAAALSTWVIWQVRPHRIVTREAYAYAYHRTNVSVTSVPRQASGSHKHISEYSPWKDLTKEEQQILSPLANRWDRLSIYQKRSLLEAAKRYPKMTKQQQARFASRVVQWTKLTKQERKTARQRYAELSKLPKEKQLQAEQWWLAQHAENAEGGTQ